MSAEDPIYIVVTDETTEEEFKSSIMKNKLDYVLRDSKNFKALISDKVNYSFDKNNGNMAVWGKTKEEDPDFSPYGNFILDIEITTKCKGPRRKDENGILRHALCNFCYKSNTPDGKNMSLDMFKNILDRMPPVLTQIAFGADAQAEANPKLFDMMRYSRSKGIIPNITVADISDEIADQLVANCGAVAVSRYADKDVCYDSIKKLTDRGLTQTNMHFCIFEESYDQAIETMMDMKSDQRLAKMNAIVFLSLKKKGRGKTGFTPLSQEKFATLVNKAFELEIPFGFDSCGANKFLESIKDRPDYKQLSMLAEPCESTGMSFYIDTDGNGFPCSFAEGSEGWSDGIPVYNCENFVKDVWMNPRIKEFRENIIGCGRSCFLYNV